MEENDVDLSAPLEGFDSGMQEGVEAEVEEWGDGYIDV